MWPNADALAVCRDRKVIAQIPDAQTMLGLAKGFDVTQKPLNGLRHPIVGSTNGWYVWSGEVFPDKDDAFEPFCLKHLIDQHSVVLPFLCLPPGWRFLKAGDYVHIWSDKELLRVE